MKVSVVLTVLILPGSGGLLGRNLFTGESPVTPEILMELTEEIGEVTTDLGYEGTNVTLPTRLGILYI